MQAITLQAHRAGIIRLPALAAWQVPGGSRRAPCRRAIFGCDRLAMIWTSFLKASRSWLVPIFILLYAAGVPLNRTWWTAELGLSAKQRCSWTLPLLSPKGGCSCLPRASACTAKLCRAILQGSPETQVAAGMARAAVGAAQWHLAEVASAHCGRDFLYPPPEPRSVSAAVGITRYRCCPHSAVRKVVSQLSSI